MATTEHKSWDQILAEGASIEISGQTFEMKPLTIGDQAAFAAWIRQRNLKAFTQACGFMRPVVQSATLAELASKAFTDTELVAEAYTAPGAEWILKRAIKGKPDLSLVPYTELLNKVSVVLELSGIIKFTEENEINSDPTEKTAATGDESVPS